MCKNKKVSFQRLAIIQNVKVNGTGVLYLFLNLSLSQNCLTPEEGSTHASQKLCTRTASKTFHSLCYHSAPLAGYWTLAYTLTIH